MPRSLVPIQIIASVLDSEMSRVEELLDEVALDRTWSSMNQASCPLDTSGGPNGVRLLLQAAPPQA